MAFDRGKNRKLMYLSTVKSLGMKPTNVEFTKPI